MFFCFQRSCSLPENLSSVEKVSKVWPFGAWVNNFLITKITMRIGHWSKTHFYFLNWVFLVFVCMNSFLSPKAISFQGPILSISQYANPSVYHVQCLYIIVVFFSKKSGIIFRIEDFGLSHVFTASDFYGMKIGVKSFCEIRVDITWMFLNTAFTIYVILPFITFDVVEILLFYFS